MTRNEEVSLGGIEQVPLERQGLDVLLGHYPDAVLLKVDTQRERDLLAGPRKYRQSDGSWLCIDLLFPVPSPDAARQRFAIWKQTGDVYRVLNEYFEVEEDPFLWPEGGPFRSERRPEWTQTHSG